jgi:hypothetical protein
MKYNTKHGGGLLNSVKGAMNTAKGAMNSAGVKVPSVSELAQKVTNAVMSPGSPLAQAASVATSLPGKLTEVIDTVQDAPDTIAQAAADKATEAIDARLAEVGTQPIPTAAPTPAPTDGYGAPSETDPGSEYHNNASSGGGGYETVHLSKPPKDPLHVFYLDGRPIYFTDNGKGRVKILPMHVGMQMAKTSSRHKYTKKMRQRRKTRSTKKSRAKGVRKTSRKAKQHHSRKR